MVKLYYTPSSCGAASFLAAYMAGFNVETEQVDLRNHKTRDGLDFYSINPKGNVPCLILDDGMILNESVSVLQYIADRNPGTIAPENGSPDRYLLQNVLSYISSEVHPFIADLFYNRSDEVRDFIKSRVVIKLEYLENVLIDNKQFLVGSNAYTIADYYLYVVLRWCSHVGLQLTAFPKVKVYFERLEGTKKIKEVMVRMASNPRHVL